MKRLFTIYYTLIFLKPIQIRYQLKYRIRRFWRKISKFQYRLSIETKGEKLKFIHWIDKNSSFNNNSFTFLNLTKKYSLKNGSSQIEWNDNSCGKLWNYNLNYMDYLLQPNMDTATGIKLIELFIENLLSNSTGLEPYPLALRGINWIKFLSTSASENFTTSLPSISSSLYAQYKILLDNLEYHLLGNHLLEDGFSLLFGAFYFKDHTFFLKANEIIQSELNEQILSDGGHFELSPMYHQIILERTLDCINLLKNNDSFKDQEYLEEKLREKAILMIKWLKAITFSNGEIPFVNDSAPGIAPSTERLIQYSIRLGITDTKDVGDFENILTSSGYRRYNSKNYECLIDVGNIGPSYQPGHAHADTLNFLLNYYDNPIFIDPGISTYEPNLIRLQERSSLSHNTVTVKNENSSEVWSSFRVGRRAFPKIVEERFDSITAKHNGYIKFGVIHQRQWIFKDNKIEIIDNLESSHIVKRNQASTGVAHFWISPQIVPEIKNNRVKLLCCSIEFKNAESIQLFKTNIPHGYNKYNESHKIEVAFRNLLESTINFESV